MQVFRRDSLRSAFFGAILAGALTCLPAAALTEPSALNDHGTLEVSMAGKIIGSEEFQILSSGNKIIAKAEIELRATRGGKTMVLHSFPELVLDSQLAPLSYTWVQKGAENAKFRVDFTTAPAKAHYYTVNGKDDYRDFLLPKDVVLLDDNVLSQYEILVARYDRTSRGMQTFRAFIPQEALPGQVKVVETGIEQVEINGNSESLRHLMVTTDLARIDLWVDSQGRLQRVSVPAMRFTAVRRQADGR
jgi:hypothetical protein